MVLKVAPLPEDIKKLGAEGVNRIWRDEKLRGAGMKRAIAEVGDIGRFDTPKQLQKLAGYAIVANDSGKHTGESRISYRGRKHLRYVLYEAAISVVAVACKLIRIFYAILTKGVDYDGSKLLGDIRRPQVQAA